jgi:hypothetical protein
MFNDPASHRRSRRRMRNISPRVWETVGGIFVTVTFALLFTYVIINWIMGCGESFPTADGSRVMGECISLGQMFLGE